MIRTHVPALLAVVGLALPLSLAAAPSQASTTSTAGAPVAAKARTFKNCTEMQKVYPHGVGRPGARDKTSGKPVTNFKRSKALYNANTKSDRDKDGIACEKA